MRIGSVQQLLIGYVTNCCYRNNKLIDWLQRRQIWFENCGVVGPKSSTVCSTRL